MKLAILTKKNTLMALFFNLIKKEPKKHKTNYCLSEQMRLFHKSLLIYSSRDAINDDPLKLKKGKILQFSL